MGIISTHMSMSLDGFVADHDDGVGPLFDWYANGDVDYAMPGQHGAAHTTMTRASVDFLSAAIDGLGAIVAGRRLFDHAHGWGGAHPAGRPVVVCTHTAPQPWVDEHPDADLEFVTGGLPAALERARSLAGDKVVSVASPDLVRQCLNAGLLDEVVVSVVPVLFGAGIRFFDGLDGRTVLDDPEIVAGTRVTHLRYRVRH